MTQQLTWVKKKQLLAFMSDREWQCINSYSILMLVKVWANDKKKLTHGPRDRQCLLGLSFVTWQLIWVKNTLHLQVRGVSYKENEKRKKNLLPGAQKTSTTSLGLFLCSWVLLLSLMWVLMLVNVLRLLSMVVVWKQTKWNDYLDFNQQSHVMTSDLWTFELLEYY